jgi:hypothetical protein
MTARRPRVPSSHTSVPKGGACAAAGPPVTSPRQQTPLAARLSCGVPPQQSAQGACGPEHAMDDPEHDAEGEYPFQLHFDFQCFCCAWEVFMVFSTCWPFCTRVLAQNVKRFLQNIVKVTLYIHIKFLF